MSGERLLLEDGAAKAILEEARSIPLEEVCGLLVGESDSDGARAWRVVSCRNIEPVERRGNRFSIDPREIIEVERSLRGSGVEVVGFYHSHPFSDGVPSGVDLTFMELWPDAVWLIAERTGEVKGGKLRAWKWAPESPGRARELAVKEVGSEG